MSERFIKLIPSEEAMFLLMNKPNAFHLLTIIATQARRNDGHPDGLHPGDCYIGDWKSYHLSERQYRTAKSILEKRCHIKIIETCRNRKKSTTGTTTVGTLVRLISSNIYDLNLKPIDDRHDDRATTERRPSDDEQRKNKNVKKENNNTGVAVSFHECLKENKNLTDEEKSSLTPFSQDRVLAALAYAPTAKIKTTLIATLIWHCSQPEIIPPIQKKQDLRKSVRQRFPNNSIHNQATCYHAPGKIRFERGMTGYELDDKEPEYEEKLKEILSKLSITL